MLNPTTKSNKEKMNTTTETIKEIKTEQQFKKYVINDFLKTIDINDLMAFNPLNNINQFWDQYNEKVFENYEYSVYNEQLLNTLPYIFEQCKEINEEYGLNIIDNIIYINAAIFKYIQKHLKLKHLINK